MGDNWNRFLMWFINRNLREMLFCGGLFVSPIFVILLALGASLLFSGLIWLIAGICVTFIIVLNAERKISKIYEDAPYGKRLRLVKLAKNGVFLDSGTVLWRKGGRIVTVMLPSSAGSSDIMSCEVRVSVEMPETLVEFEAKLQIQLKDNGQEGADRFELSDLTQALSDHDEKTTFYVSDYLTTRLNESLSKQLSKQAGDDLNMNWPDRVGKAVRELERQQWHGLNCVKYITIFYERKGIVVKEQVLTGFSG